MDAVDGVGFMGSHTVVDRMMPKRHILIVTRTCFPSDLRAGAGPRSQVR